MIYILLNVTIKLMVIFPLFNPRTSPGHVPGLPPPWFFLQGHCWSVRTTRSRSSEAPVLRAFGDSVTAWWRFIRIIWVIWLIMAYNPTNYSWLVVWNICYFPFHCNGMSSETHWRTLLFFKMVIAPPTSTVFLAPNGVILMFDGIIWLFIAWGCIWGDVRSFSSTYLLIPTSRFGNDSLGTGHACPTLPSNLDCVANSAPSK